MVTMTSIERFLAGRRLAVVGASDERGNFGGTIATALRDHGYEVVAVHPSRGDVARLEDLDRPVDGAVLVVNPAAAADAVRSCVELGIEHVWLFKGLGGSGAVSDEVLELCDAHHVDVVAGACPLMFLEPVGWAHRLHRYARRRNGSLVVSSR